MYVRSANDRVELPENVPTMLRRGKGGFRSSSAVITADVGRSIFREPGDTKQIGSTQVPAAIARSRQLGITFHRATRFAPRGEHLLDPRGTAMGGEVSLPEITR